MNMPGPDDAPSSPQLCSKSVGPPPPLPSFSEQNQPISRQQIVRGGQDNHFATFKTKIEPLQPS